MNGKFRVGPLFHAMRHFGIAAASHDATDSTPVVLIILTFLREFLQIIPSADVQSRAVIYLSDLSCSVDFFCRQRRRKLCFRNTFVCVCVCVLQDDSESRGRIFLYKIFRVVRRLKSN